MPAISEKNDEERQQAVGQLGNVVLIQPLSYYLLTISSFNFNKDN